MKCQLIIVMNIKEFLYPETHPRFP